MDTDWDVLSSDFGKGEAGNEDVGGVGALVWVHSKEVAMKNIDILLLVNATRDWREEECGLGCGGAFGWHFNGVGWGVM